MFILNVFLLLAFSIFAIAISAINKDRTERSFGVAISVIGIIISSFVTFSDANRDKVNTSMLVPIGQLGGDEIHVSVADGVATIASESYPFIWQGTPTEALVVLSYIGSTSAKDSTYYPLGLMDIMALSASGESIIVDEQ